MIRASWLNDLDSDDAWRSMRKNMRSGGTWQESIAREVSNGYTETSKKEVSEAHVCHPTFLLQRLFKKTVSFWIAHLALLPVKCSWKRRCPSGVRWPCSSKQTLKRSNVSS